MIYIVHITPKLPCLRRVLLSTIILIFISQQHNRIPCFEIFSGKILFLYSNFAKLSAYSLRETFEQINILSQLILFLLIVLYKVVICKIKSWNIQHRSINNFLCPSSFSQHLLQFLCNILNLPQ